MPQGVALSVSKHLRIEAGRMIRMVGQLDRRDETIAEALESPLEEDGEIRIGQPNKRPPQDEAIDQIDEHNPDAADHNLPGERGRLDPPIERQRDPECSPEPGNGQREALEPDVAAYTPPQLRQKRVDLRSERAARGVWRVVRGARGRACAPRFV